MYSLDELKNQNQEISQLCDVLSVLMEKPTLHDNPFVNELMTRFKEKVWMHLVFEDKTIYAALLKTDNDEINKIAQDFHNSAKDIKHRFTVFVRNWANKTNSNDRYEAISKESTGIINSIRDRIDYENKHMFPLVE